MDFTHPHFAEPAWLWVALLAPLAVGGLQFHAWRSRRRELARLAHPAALSLMLQAHSRARRTVKNLLRLVLVCLLGLTLARPQWGERTEPSEAQGEDVVFVLDCSQSMTATDVAPSRLARAKLAIQEFARNSGRGRLGLVAFAGQAFLQCPLTSDYDAFGDALAAADERTIPVPGTDIGRGLSEGYAATEKNGRRKLLVLISDGEDLEKASVAAAKSLAAKDVIVFTVGVGTAAGSELYVANAAGGREKLLAEQGQPVVSRLDESTLRAIAEATHGRYQPLGALGDGLDPLRQALEEPAGVARFATARRDGVDHFQATAALALILLVGESLLSTRRAIRTSQPRGRGWPVPAGVTLLLLVCALSSRGVEIDAEGPTSARARFNLGASQLQQGHWREAETMLNAAVNANDPAIQPLALFNLGHLRFHAGQELLKAVAPSEELEAQGDKAIAAAGPVIKSADAAIAGDDLRAAALAYRSVNSTLRGLKKLLDTIKGSVDTCGTALERWQRAGDDFRSAAELRINYEVAQTNAWIMDLHVAELTNERWRLQEIQEAVDTQRAALQARLDALKKKLPPEATKNEHGDSSDAKSPNEHPKPEEQPDKNDQGKEMVLTPEEAMRLLSSLKLDLSRQYSAGNPPDTQKKNAGRNW